MASDPHPEQQKGKAVTARDNSRVLAAAILGGLGAIFAIVNLDKVEVDWIFGHSDTPLIVVIALCLALGFVLGTLTARRRAASKQR